MDKLNNRGQSLFEFIIFLPVLMLLYTVFYTVGNSINGSINQQKAVRSYYYHTIKGNSYINTFKDLASSGDRNVINVVGFFAIGWRESPKVNDSIAPCFTFMKLFGANSSTETCEEVDSGNADRTSQFIRLYTMYGICGPEYHKATDEMDNHEIFVQQPRANSASCTTR